MSSYRDFIDAGAKMDLQPYKSNVATSQCALNYTGSSFAGGKVSKASKAKVSKVPKVSKAKATKKTKTKSK